MTEPNSNEMRYIVRNLKDIKAVLKCISLTAFAEFVYLAVLTFLFALVMF